MKRWIEESTIIVEDDLRYVQIWEWMNKLAGEGEDLKNRLIVGKRDFMSNLIQLGAMDENP